MITTAPLSKSQYGIYAECIGHEGEIFYNLPYIRTLDSSIDAERMARAVETAVKAHPTLLSRIVQGDDGEPLQTLDVDNEPFEVVVRDVDDIEAEKLLLPKPFDLLGGRLIRIELLRSRGQLYMFIDSHHIVTDGTTLNALLEDIDRAYSGEAIEPEEFTMAQMAIEEAARRQTPDFDVARQWYAEHFDCGDTYTPLMPDREEPQLSGAHLLRTIDVTPDAVQRFCKENGVYKSTLFNAAYSLMLARFNNENEALYTTVYSGRNDKRFARSAGMAVKTLPVYAKFDADTTVMQFLMAHQEQMEGCRKHDIYSYSDMVGDLHLQSNTMFVWHGDLFGKDTMAGKPMITERIGISTLSALCYIKAYALSGQYYVEAEYKSNAYSETLIDHILNSYEAALKGLLVAERLADIDITTASQRAQLDAFNQTYVDYDESQTIVSLFARQAAATPDAEAVVYKDVRLTYAMVGELSDRIAAHVGGLGLGAEDVVSVLIPRCQWMAVASLGVLKAGCAYQPLDPSYPAERLAFMMQDANAGLLIADADLLSLVPDYKGPVLLTRDIESLPTAPAPQVAVKPEQLFILLYTSGSTGVPKGVQLTHGNLVAFCHWYKRYYDLKSESRVAAYASYGFDACMMDMYPALTSGASVYIVPEEIRLDLVALSDYFEQQGITHSFMTTQVGYQFATSVDCHSLEHLSVGGEKLAAITPPKDYRFHNGYGPTECTIFTTVFEVRKPMREIPIGKQLDNLRLYVVDSQGRRQPVGAAGELWVAGPQVGRGYLNRPEKTAEVFISNPFCSEATYDRVYRTGDIVRFLPSGDVQFVGRRDGQVKIRGFRIELKEVEAVIREFPGIKDATVQAFDDEGGGKYIAAYVVSDQPVDIEALNAFILDRKPPYMVPAATMQLDAIPLNQNQKVNKRALPRPEKRTASELVESNAPLNVLEQQLHDMVSQIVGNTDFGITTVLGYVGLTSISAIKLAVQVNKRFDVALDTKSLVKTGTVQSIENEILKHMLEQGVTHPAAEQQPSTETEKLVEAPLTYAQTGVYFDCLKNPASTIYNIPYLLTWPQGVTTDALIAAVRKLWDMHPSLRAHFETHGGDIVQTIADAPELSIDVVEMSDDELNDYKNKFVRPFNLQRPPLCRFEVVVTPSAVHLLMDVHHLLFDGGSADLFIRELADLLEGRDVAGEQVSYLDFAVRQKKDEQTEAFAQAGRFFAEQLATCEGASEIPADLKAGDEQGLIGEVVVPVDHERVADFCRHQGITPAHLFYAATAYVASRYTGSRDVYLCTVSSGRSNLSIADTVGMFVGTLPLHLSIDDVTVADLLHNASASFDETLRNESYPFTRIASDYNFRPAIAYAYQVGVLSEYKLCGQAIGLQLLELNVPKFKINVKIEDVGVSVQYDDAAYSHDLGLSLAENIATVAAAMVAHPEARVRQLSMVSERQAIQLDALRAAPCEDAPLSLMHDCIAHYAAIQPNHQALVADDASFTYAEMDRMTLRIAHGLRQRGVQPRDRVALLLPRTSRLILTQFAVLRAGAAYIPCDPEYPADRVKLILEDSEARFIVTTADRVDTLPEGKGIDVEQLVACDDESPIEAGITPDDLAYLIYTSGSTGRPKGVMLRHEGICNYLYGHPANVLANAVATDASRVLSVTTISFDAALQDIGIALYNGKTLVVATEEQTGNPLELARLITEQHIDMVSGTPSRWLTWLTSDDFCKAISNIRIARAGGEKFSDQLLNQLRSVTQARIFNCYGPTETTVASNNKELTPDTQVVTVGRPQLGVREFIVDNDGNELPVGVVGELYIGGRGVGRGYNNLDEMTRERFIDYHGERIYRSGDYAKWLPDGDVLILGRTDNQIKLRGLRIELGEIENVMLKVEGMEKVVIVIRQIAGKEHLCAYYTADHAIVPDELKAEIAKSLTQYMVPTAYLQLDRMPMTPNGKTDVKALPEPQLAAAGAYEEPVTDTERTFCQIFADILQMERVGATDNFFDLGGTSLVVTRVIIEADKADLHVAYGDVFANPTPRGLARLVTGEAVDTADNADDVATYDYTTIDSLLKSSNNLDTFRNGERQSLGDVLVTGATGFLGIHILNELISSDAPNIYCLVRGRNVEEAEGRLKTLLFYYFDNAYDDLFGSRLHIVLGDVTRDLDPQLKVDTIFNCAAVVKHFAEGTEIEDVNVGGAQRCVDYCLSNGARLIHISTASTRGLWAGTPRDAIFTEQRFYLGQFLGNKYIHSKFLAERLILEAVAQRGLNAKIMRVGNLAARSTDGEFQANFSTNSFMGRIKVYNMLGVCPYAMRSKNVEFSPINEVSRAIVLLSTTPRECCVFHPYNNHLQLLGDVLKGLLSVGPGVRFVEMEEFEQAMDVAKNDPVKSKSMASLLAYQDMAHGQRTTDVTRDNDYTTQVLYRLGFEWSPTSWDYVERMIIAIGGLGFFD